jgi:RHS repeat-associated protein
VVNRSGHQLEHIRYTPYGVPVALSIGDTNDDGVHDSSDTHASLGTSVLGDLDMDGTVGDSDDLWIFTDRKTNQQPYAWGRPGDDRWAIRHSYAGYMVDRELDGERTIYHQRHRVYGAEMGQWTRRDPLGYVDGVDLYRYVSASPIGFVDHNGLCQDSVTVSIPSLIAGGFTAEQIAVMLGISVAVAEALIAEWKRAQELAEPHIKGPPKPGRDRCQQIKAGLNSLKRSLRSYDRLIQKHLDKIADPFGAGELTDVPYRTVPGALEGVKRKWKREIETFRRNKTIAEKAMELLRKAARDLGCRL